MRVETAPTGVVALMVGTVSNCAYGVRLQTAPTGPGEHIELPIYFLKPHQTAPTGVIAWIFPSPVQSVQLILNFTIFNAIRMSTLQTVFTFRAGHEGVGRM